MNNFEEGDRIEALAYRLSETDVSFNEGEGGVKSITVTMVNGQMAEVPWAVVEFDSDKSKLMINLALCNSVALYGEVPIEEESEEEDGEFIIGSVFYESDDLRYSGETFVYRGKLEGDVHPNPSITKTTIKRIPVIAHYDLTSFRFNFYTYDLEGLK